MVFTVLFRISKQKVKFNNAQLSDKFSAERGVRFQISLPRGRPIVVSIEVLHLP